MNIAIDIPSDGLSPSLNFWYLCKPLRSRSVEVEERLTIENDVARSWALKSRIIYGVSVYE